jgi:hypothetical protein
MFYVMVEMEVMVPWKQMHIYTKQCISQLICKQRHFSAPMIFIIFHMYILRAILNNNV